MAVARSERSRLVHAARVAWRARVYATPHQVTRAHARTRLPACLPAAWMHARA
jgi:hypothetical protein